MSLDTAADALDQRLRQVVAHATQAAARAAETEATMREGRWRAAILARDFRADLEALSPCP